MSIKKGLLLFIACCGFICPAIAQPTIGIPAIKNYTHTDYNADTEIWDIKQDKNGVMYFANNDGLLSFDGSYWKIYQMPNKAAIKSLAIDPLGRIYVGGQDEVGYFFPDNNGVLKFHSLKNLLPKKAQQFADIWTIVLFNNEVFFRTIECIFELKDNEMKTFDAPGGWRLLAKAGSRLYADDKDSGLMIFKDGQWQHCCGPSYASNVHITSIIDYKKDTLLITTLKKGLFLLSGASITKKTTDIDPVLTNDLITCTKKIGDDRYAIGSTAKGLFIINGKGNLLDHFSNNEGLQNNNVHSVFLDNDRNLWLGLENGLDFINYNTSVKHIYISKENQARSNAIIVFDKKLFIGTTNGLYSVPLDRQTDISKCKGIFSEVGNTKGQVLSLSNINNSLIAGHNEGGMLVQNNQARLITAGHGAWMFKPIPNSPDIVLSTYTGLQLVQNNGTGVFNDLGKIDGIYETLPIIARDNNNIIWASHPNRGIYKIQLSPDRRKIVIYTQYTDKSGLPSIMNNHVYFIKDKVIAATEKGVYEYSAANNKFIPSAFYKPVFGGAPVECLTVDKDGNIWFISNQRVGVIDFSKPPAGKPYKVIYFPELTGQAVKGSEFIYPYNDENIFIGSNNGVFHLNYRQYVSTENKLNVLLTTVKTIAEKDSLVFGGYFVKNGQVYSAQNPKNIITVSNHWNSFHFEYSSTLFAQKSNEEFSYKLTGFDRGWSKWSVKTEKDYTNLPYGHYTFSVRARNNLGNASAPINYTFVVEPAWYQTIWAYLFYISFMVYTIYLAAKSHNKRLALHQKRHDEEQRRLQYLHSLELDRNEKEIIALKNDNLETQLNYKNKELATLTMHLVDRGRLLLDIKDELMLLTKKLNIPDPAYQFRSVFKLLSGTDKNDDDWNQFAIYFDQVHNNFLSTMKAKFPGLSATDLKLCAYLRLNLTSKEIAQLLNISLKGVEISRYRVRKKLNLSTDIHLYDFLIEVTS